MWRFVKCDACALRSFSICTSFFPMCILQSAFYVYVLNLNGYTHTHKHTYDVMFNQAYTIRAVASFELCASHITNVCMYRVKYAVPIVILLFDRFCANLFLESLAKNHMKYIFVLKCFIKSLTLENNYHKKIRI